MNPGEAAVIDAGEPVAVAAVRAIRAVDVAALEEQLRERPDLATARPERNGVGHTLLHVVTDWPGHFPNGAASVAALVGAGADVNAPVTGPHAETPLHWAASSDDVEVLDGLLDAGADIDAPAAVVAGGSPLRDATAFGQSGRPLAGSSNGAHERQASTRRPSGSSIGWRPTSRWGGPLRRSSTTRSGRPVTADSARRPSTSSLEAPTWASSRGGRS